jgi:transcription initiation factor IIF auxiliary subunit
LQEPKKEKRSMYITKFIYFLAETYTNDQQLIH